MNHSIYLFWILESNYFYQVSQILKMIWLQMNQIRKWIWMIVAKWFLVPYAMRYLTFALWSGVRCLIFVVWSRIQCCILDLWSGIGCLMLVVLSGIRYTLSAVWSDNHVTRNGIDGNCCMHWDFSAQLQLRDESVLILKLRRVQKMEFLMRYVLR